MDGDASQLMLRGTLVAAVLAAWVLGWMGLSVLWLLAVLLPLHWAWRFGWMLGDGCGMNVGWMGDGCVMDG